MPEPIIIERLNREPIYVQPLISDAPLVVAVQGLVGPPGPTVLANTAMAITIDGNGQPFLPGPKADLPVPFNGRVVGWTAFGDLAGDVTVDIRVAPFADYPPGPEDSITGAAPIALVGASKGTGDATGWNVELSEGDVVRYEVISNAIIRRLTVALLVERD